jgi:carbamoyl-phosphate synthase large subunit
MELKLWAQLINLLDLAEDRGSFSTLLKDNNIPYPEFGVAETADEALILAEN